jgi:hypothetical protein
MALAKLCFMTKSTIGRWLREDLDKNVSIIKPSNCLIWWDSYICYWFSFNIICVFFKFLYWGKINCEGCNKFEVSLFGITYIVFFECWKLETDQMESLLE